MKKRNKRNHDLIKIEIELIHYLLGNAGHFSGCTWCENIRLLVLFACFLMLGVIADFYVGVVWC